MEKRAYRALGIVFVILGVVSLLSSFGSITGYVTLNEFREQASSIVGVLLIIGGIVLIMVGRGEEDLEGKVKIIKTRRFEKAIRRHDLAAINRAIARIGTGLGKEEKLVGREDYSIRAGEGKRVIFEYNDDHKIATLTDYTSTHNYKRHTGGR